MELELYYNHEWRKKHRDLKESIRMMKIQKRSELAVKKVKEQWLIKVLNKMKEIMII